MSFNFAWLSLVPILPFLSALMILVLHVAGPARG